MIAPAFPALLNRACRPNEARIVTCTGSADLDSQALYFRLIKRLGRNARAPSDASSSRADGVLDAADAGALWSALLQQQFTPSQEAALLMGLRVHGESAAMLAAFATASQAQMNWIKTQGTPVAC